MTDRTFHFTLGPVQSFVAQARRTRDFWAGSFLLSWLAGAAMQTVIAQKGTIAFPTADEGYLGWLRGKESGKRPRQGSIPNRFKATIGEHFQPVLVERAVRDAWRAVAETVWHADLERHCQRYPDSRGIWDRQIDGFWEIAWALGEDDALLDRRKNWRTQLAPDEAGIKCSVMAGWQELSGLPAPDAEALDAFWQPVRADCGRDLAEDETLCAIAFVKRRFPHYFAQVQADLPGGWTLHGWCVNPRTPSTLDLAAAPWLARVVRQESAAALLRLQEAARPLFPPGDSGIDRLRCVKEAYRGRDGLTQPNSSALFSHVLDNKKECSNPAVAREMKQAIKALNLKEHPSPFYAILLMDGDSLGELLRKSGVAVSKALEIFTDQVPDIVDRHNGFLIYAGGDDVLALLPLEDALQCAAAIRQCYRDAFAAQNLESTISAAVEYAHVKMPLTRILRDAHQLLDEVAKEQRGRDSIAVRVWKPGGRALEWAMPWERALVGSPPHPNSPPREGRAHSLKIEQLAAQFARDDAAAKDKEADRFSSKFFYKIREHFDLFNPVQAAETAIFNEQEALSLLAVDYLASGVNEGRSNKLKIKEAEHLIQPLLEQCRPVVRYLDGKSMTLRPKEKLEANGILFRKHERLEADGALLVRFLAHKGVER
ncbi:MAG: type III-B CRISPR-associated protein Cas10/Cmr2 [Candidatus Competibacteraceae bacterium]|nr:MAG: type III-B CRISPR-associated protein Cas10/Cmr2 [Candidatus Competibacteraceae bacterium]